MSDFTKLGHTRRSNMMYPTDLWPNGVEIPIESGLFEIYPGEGIFNKSEGRVTESNWSLVIAPLKDCHNFTIRSTREEYAGCLDKDGNVLFNTFDEQSGPHSIPVNAKYVYKTCRNVTASNILKGITFYYYPTHSDNLGDTCAVVVNQDNSPYAGGGANNYSNFIALNGAHKVKYSISFRGCAHWYGADKNKLFARSYGEEAGTYTAPEDACYFKSQGYDSYVVDQSFIARYTLE